MSEYLLEVRNVNKSFGGVVTANDVCMSVEPGQIRGLIGPNGAGKTTLLNLISGIYDVDGGNIFFNGKDVTKLPTHVRAKMGIGRTFQSPRFMNRASIEDNLKVGTDLLNQFGYIQSFFGKKGHDFMKNLEELMEIAGFTFDWQDQITSLPYGQQKLLEEMEIPLAQVLARMENIGFLVDGESIRVYGERLETEIEALQKQIYEEVGYEFNINSPKQLGDALFVKLGLPSGKKTKTGYSTNAEILEKLRYDHPAVELVLHYRTLTKLKSTYCEGMLKVIGPDGRIHSNFNQTETRTGRISSTEPNLQNIPVRTELGRELRKFFLAKEGWVLVDADYSQIELRVLAHIAHDENMIKAFQDKEDIHTITASQVFGMPPEMVTPLMRSRAKAVNFGIVYGIGAFSLSKDINVSRKEAQRYIDDYLTLYSGVDRYMKEVVEKAKEDGYVETLFHRRRYLPELTASNFNLRAFGERVARNMPIQGTAADIIKIAMVRVDRRLKRENMRARLILQVHDELIVEAPEDEAEQAARILTEEMEGAVSLTVPMVAEASVGKTWYDAKG